ncbi:ergot alkaloid biosynthesis protein [Micromonospora ureilytica]|uniref:Ergot alkaloid biosynthesis protein n=1 Tax=Micromonospora ureilytica TaxID=709868 RepID=A0A3N9X6C4_9ACTN|nr:NAD-dependent epimerase/dehydratase family protein [Micromonospora ureilytica]RQX08654.1 ergot alkaloid biosynthesis protein [Micromonospora ureilytica]
MILVIGGTGTTGRLVAAKLAERGHRTRIASRRPSAGGVRFDWRDPTTHSDALGGVHAIYAIPPVGEIDPAPVMLPFLELARSAGARRVVLLSSSAVPPAEHGLGLVHARLGELFTEWAVLRPSWFMENFLGGQPHAVSAREHGEIVSATGTARVGFVDPADIAEVAVRALTDPTPHNTDHIITGPEALSYDAVAAVLTEVGGRPVRHRAIDAAELAAIHSANGLPPDFARFLASLDTAIAAGAEDRTTSTVADVTGRTPRSFRDFCRDRLRADSPG